jgi:tetratricopeptide (TPR) repeat protein
MLGIVLLVLVQTPPTMMGQPTAAPGPKASETAKLYFIAGDLKSAREWAERGLRREAKRCRPILRDLAEYAFLMSRYEPLTSEQARLVLELDRRLSPQQPGKLTRPVIERYVEGPLNRAKAWVEQGAASEAVQFVDEALAVDPHNAEAIQLKNTLLSHDAGH